MGPSCWYWKRADNLRFTRPALSAGRSFSSQSDDSEIGRGAAGMQRPNPAQGAYIA
jgi:hypothetical protein